MPSEFELAVIIVTWNTRDLMPGCLDSALAELNGINGRIIVVDNDSSDGTPELIEKDYPSVTLIRSGGNLGFAAGNNVGLRHLGFPTGDDLPEYVLLLNPDTITKPRAFKTMLRAMRETNAGLAGAQLSYEDGSFQHGAFRFPGLTQLFIDLFPVPDRLYESPLNGRYSLSLYQRGEPFPIDFPLGAAFMLRRDVIEATGIFDEDFWLYCEEIDWAMRIRKAGYRAVCVPAAEIVHLAGVSTVQVRPQSFYNLWKARIQLYRKHYRPIKRDLALMILRGGIERKKRLFGEDSTLDDETRTAMEKTCDDIITFSWEGIS